ncbi:hypothetical protein CLD22_06065 [Rubrivivax gelatinosus]|nr:hypothetical protein [Rubrivivax gelatinosus]
MPNFVREGHVAYENFNDAQLPRARFAWNQAGRAADLAVKAVRQFQLPANAQLISRWFGLTPATNPAHAALLMQVQDKLGRLDNALRSNSITLVYRPDIVVKTAPHDPSLAQQPVLLNDGTPFTGGNVYGYVHTHQAGSGYRIVMGRWFMDDPDQQEATQTLYHELTHKVIRTVDHCYGTQACRQLAQSTPAQACNNADNYGYFAKSMVAQVL